MRVVVQKREVYDFFMMLGDVGGLFDFCFYFLSTICGLLSSKLLKASMISSLFHAAFKEVTQDFEPTNSLTPQQILKEIRPIKFYTCFTLLNAMTFGLVAKMGRNKRRANLLRHGKDRI